VSTFDSPLANLVLRIPCPRCKALAGAWCTNAKGVARHGHLHGQRRSPIETAHHDGYTEGYHDGIDWERKSVGRFFSDHVKEHP